jgi:hypothetical protein
MGKGIFSENRGVIDDALGNAEDFDQIRGGVREDVKERVVQDGVLTMIDCPYCGMQRWDIVKWPEFWGFFTGQPVPNTAASKVGVEMLFGCRKCNNGVRIRLSWDDIERYVAKAVKGGMLPQDIYRARDQILAERAKRQQGRR